jgi:hypothetical protein
MDIADRDSGTTILASINVINIFIVIRPKEITRVRGGSEIAYHLLEMNSTGGLAMITVCESIRISVMTPIVSPVFRKQSLSNIMRNASKSAHDQQESRALAA